MLMIGIAGKTLAPEEWDWIRAPMVCGVILFTRNFSSREQVSALCAEIRALRGGRFLIAVDQEGGPVQRFRDGFTELPALARLGERYATDAAGALQLAEQHGWLMAGEMLALGIDLSFAPCIDLKRGNRAIGIRAFHDDPAVVAAFAAAYVRGMHRAGMAATLKHFPGHGSVLEDTHFDAALDPRPLAVIEREDLYPFGAGFAAGAEAVMMAHVAYPEVAPEPAGYSPRWIREILQQQMKFAGIVFSDDIGMAAAESAGGIKARIDVHLDAGCDIVLVCAPTIVAEAIAAVSSREPVAPPRWVALLARAQPDWSALVEAEEVQQTRADLAALRLETLA
ncbi:MAG: beta-N-acetylhexosaminidase [Xanthomonadales bacterium]|nr:beta-N-acetylhexosaminidase [Xanthomonadales bacterium]